jgi:energy-coupling factor transporter ATP-binding protein EcfA2
MTSWSLNLQVLSQGEPGGTRGGQEQLPEGILSRNQIDEQTFIGAIRKALSKGAKRHCNVALVGDGGCGKSSLIEALEEIFSCAPKPQNGSSFPLTAILDCEIMLWQDYSHCERTLAFTDLLALFVGESIGVRRPSLENKKLQNIAPCFYTGRVPISSSMKDPASRKTLESMMNERFQIFQFNVPLPMQDRRLHIKVVWGLEGFWSNS